MTKETKALLAVEKAARALRLNLVSDEEIDLADALARLEAVRRPAGAACPGCKVVVTHPQVFFTDEDGLCRSCGSDPCPVDSDGRVVFEK